MNTRRRLLVALGAGALTGPFESFGQQGKVWRIGFLSEYEPNINASSVDGFKLGLRELGYAESKDYVIEQRFTQYDLARLPALAVELLALKVDLIVVQGTPSAIAARKATSEIPIIIAIVGDPVGSGLAESLRRPGGNVTGLTNISAELVTKRLDLLRQISPGMRRAAFLYNPDSVNDTLGLREFESTCQKLGFKSIVTPVRNQNQIAVAFSIMKRERAQGLVVTNTFAWRQDIITQAANVRLPAIYSGVTWGDSGGLLSYSANNPDLFRRAAAYAVKIFKGAKPGDLPIEQPMTFDMVLNLRTAKALGLKIPNSILVQATKVIK